MDANQIINLAVPVFGVLLIVELLLSWRRGWGYFGLDDSLMNLSLGLGRQLVDIFVKVFYFAAYVLIYEHWQLFTLASDHWLTWVLAFIGVDFIYYWQHRWSHEINVLWGGHLVHHSSEEFNTTVALRQSFVHDLMVYPLFFVLALLGLPPLHFFVAVAVLAIYQYWIHTRAIGRFPEWLEGLINTPSNHRVHHGSNKLYVDRNYGGILMIWDRLFGTWQAETETVHYGLTKPVKTWNPLWVNLQYFVELWQVSRQTARWRDKLAVWWRRPGWLPADLPMPAPQPSPRTGFKFNTTLARPYWFYIGAQYLLLAAIGLPLMALYAEASVLAVLAALLFVFWGIGNVGGLQQSRPWLRWAEPLRLVVAMLLVSGFLLGGSAWDSASAIANGLLVTLLILLLISLVAFVYLSRHVAPAPVANQ